MRHETESHSTGEHEVIEIATDAVVRLDGCGRVSELDAMAEHLLGLPREKAVGKDLVTLLRPAGSAHALRGAVQELLAGEDGAADGPVRAPAARLTRRFEVGARHSDGLPFPLEVLLVRESEGPPDQDGLAEVRVLCLLRDMRARREAEKRLVRSESLLAEAEAVGGFGSFELDLHTGAIDCSGGLIELLGFAGPAPGRVRDLLAAFGEPERQELDRAIGRARRSGEPFELQLELDGDPEIHRRSTARWVRVRGRVLNGHTGGARLIGTLQEITDIVEARSMREFLGYVVDSSHDAIYTRDGRGRITSWNRGAERLFGFTAQEAIGSTPELTVPKQHLAANEQMIRAVMQGHVIEEVETERLRSDGSLLSVSLSLSPVRDASGRVVAVASILHDIGERKRYEQRLQHLADHDPLTDLLNRRRFGQALEVELERAHRYGTDGAVLSIDLDNLKTVNDRFGHAAGDQLIVAAAQVLSRNSRASDVVARVGGDEFGILLRSGGARQAQLAAEKLLAALRSEPLILGGCPHAMTASIGVTLFGSERMGASDVLAMADAALYEAKRTGRNRVLMMSPVDRAGLRQPRGDMTERVHRALHEDGFRLHWQPIVDLRSGAISYLEALLRMPSDDGRLIAPGAFLPAAARAGLLPELDRWVLRRGLRALAGLPESQRVPVAVNVSTATVEEPTPFAEFIDSELEEMSLDGSMLIVDISEGAAIGNVGGVRELAGRVHERGGALALDDFGSSFGSFRYLRNLPFDFIKLDAEFVRDLSSNPSDVSVIQAVVAVARGMGIKTVAESVSDDLTVELLRREGVDYAQGFHLGQPGAQMRETASAAARRKLERHGWPRHRRRSVGG